MVLVSRSDFFARLLEEKEMMSYSKMRGLVYPDHLERIVDTEIPDGFSELETVFVEPSGWEGRVVKRDSGINPEDEKGKIEAQSKAAIYTNLFVEGRKIEFPVGEVGAFFS